MIYRLQRHAKRCRAHVQSLLYGNRQGGNRGIRILMHHSIGNWTGDIHRIPVENFDRLLNEIVNSGYKTFTISELVEGILQKSPDRAIAITFDDGYKDNLLIAVKLKKMGLKATFFITTSYIDKTVSIQWSDGSPGEFMTWEDVSSLSEMGFEIGSHMVHHVDLRLLAEDDLRSEFEDSRDMISGRIGKTVDAFSYPGGYFNGRVIEMATICGYRTGCSTFYGWNTASTNPYILRRTEIDAYDTITDFRLKSCGYYDPSPGKVSRRIRYMCR